METKNGTDAGLRSKKARIVDLILAAALFALGTTSLLAAGADKEIANGLGIAMVALQTLPLYHRRRHPFIVLLAVTTASSIPPLIGFIGDNLFSLLAVVVSVYTVAAYGRVRAAVGGVVVALAGGLLHQFPQMDEFDPFFLAFAWLPMGAAAFVGSQVQLARNRTRRVQDEARLALWEKEADSRRSISQERARIARELHDLVAHNMTSIALQAGAARLYFDSNPSQARDVLKSIEEGSRKALTEMRRLLGVLRAEDDQELALAPQPSLSRIDELFRSSEAAGLEMEVSIEGEPIAISPGLDLTAYRILQEALTNSLKHGRDVSPTRVRVSYLPNHLEMNVTNPLGGSGANDKDGGQGLVGMRERASLFNGEFRAQPTDSGDFEVWVKLPLEPVP